ncbi:MAG: metallophosphoesterase family protein [Gammaproteobacteria bacterium]
MTVLLHLSDPHFGTEQRPVVEALVRFSGEHRPDLVVVSGDITQRARRGQFRAARGFVERLGVSDTLVLPGNHDIPLFNVAARLFAPYANHRREFGRDLEPVYQSEQLLVVTANTTRRYRHKHGEVCDEQIERIEARLARASAAQLRLVVTHQPVCVTRPEDRANLLRGGAEAIRRWARAGADLVLGGHIHLPFVRDLREDDPDLPRQVWAVQAGTAVSSRVRRDAPNSVNLLRWTSSSDARRCVVERWDYDRTVQEFQLAQKHHLDLEAA